MGLPADRPALGAFRRPAELCPPIPRSGLRARQAMLASIEHAVATDAYETAEELRRNGWSRESREDALKGYVTWWAERITSAAELGADLHSILEADKK